eukprot:TRINITY_DN8579_c0_g1_i1.p1 TRINITY_DN8579_c0_g1~~TRINITY_DN8579_c0_g1_i1.p1  ORF type:complete len:113 (-),score=19.21 TRINITY_DN8579_c0_g1_i1:98-412(-)
MGAEAAVISKNDVRQDKPTASSKSVSKGSLMTDEDRKMGDVSWSVYVSYFASASAGFGVFTVVAVILANSSAQVLRFACDYWLALWGQTTRTFSILNNRSNTFC